MTEEDDSLQTLEDLMKLPLWLRYPDHEFRAALHARLGKTVPEEDYNRAHDEWVKYVREATGMDDEGGIQILGDKEYIQGLIGNSQTLPVQQNMMNLAEPLVVTLARLVSSYKKVEAANIPGAILKANRTRMLEGAAEIQGFFQYCLYQLDLVSSLDNKVLDTLVGAGVDIYNAGPSPESILGATIRIQKADMMRFIREKHSEYTPVRVEDRLAALEKGGIYIKHARGAGGSMVMRLCYDGKELTVESEDERVQALIRLSNNKELLERANKKLEEGLQSEMKGDLPRDLPQTEEVEASEYGGPQGAKLRIHDLGVGMWMEDFVYAVIESGDKLSEGIAEGVPTIGLDHHLDYGDRITRIQVKPHELGDVLERLDRMYGVCRTVSYAEEDVKPPLIDGRTWEIRVINQSPDLETPEVTAMYCKIGASAVVSNIKAGGTGRDVESTVMEAYGILRPELSEDERRGLTVEYLLKVQEMSCEVAKTLGDYLTNLKDEEYPGFIIERINATDISTDFIAAIDGNRLRPVLVDVNLNYGTEALADEEAERKIEIGRRRIERKTRELLGSR